MNRKLALFILGLFATGLLALPAMAANCVWQNGYAGDGSTRRCGTLKTVCHLVAAAAACESPPLPTPHCDPIITIDGTLEMTPSRCEGDAVDAGDCTTITGWNNTTSTFEDVDMDATTMWGIENVKARAIAITRDAGAGNVTVECPNEK
jgi:hypothetical protein